jgi:hypothetical protein
VLQVFPEPFPSIPYPPCVDPGPGPECVLSTSLIPSPQALLTQPRFTILPAHPLWRSYNAVRSLCSLENISLSLTVTFLFSMQLPVDPGCSTSRRTNSRVYPISSLPPSSPPDRSRSDVPPSQLLARHTVTLSGPEGDPVPAFLVWDQSLNELEVVPASTDDKQALPVVRTICHFPILCFMFLTCVLPE